MDKITLHRHGKNQNSIFGTLNIHLQNGNYATFCTVENNGKQVKEGHYNIYHSYSPKFDTNLWTLHVPQRNGIRIHSANSGTELSGCIALGEFKLQDKIYNSRDSLKTLHTVLDKYTTYKLEIL